MPMVFYGLLFLLPFIAYFFIDNYLTGELIPLYWFGVSLYLLLWWNAVFYRLTMYLLDIWIVTDHRVIDSQQFGFFHRTVAELGLARIQDISTKLQGTMATFFNFGNLDIQTAGTEPKFRFEQIPNPAKVKDVIVHAHNEYMSTHPDEIEVHDDDKNHNQAA